MPAMSPTSPPPSPEALLEALDPEQRAVAEALRGPVRVLAGAGTGKTRAITHRIAYGVATGVYVPQQVLAVTFTTRAAGEMRQRLRVLGAPGVQARTFHSAALRQARYFWPKVYAGALPELMDSKLSLVGRAASRNRVDTSAATLRDLAGEIEWSKVSNVRPEDYERVAEARGREISVPPATVARVFSSYEDAKREAGRMDMEDVLLCAAAVISEDERVAAEIRRQYTHFVVDEFQDVSPIQATLLDLWLGGRHELCVVGDPAQTIYSFAGASARHLQEFPQRHPGTTSVELVRNYRSTPQVVAAANAVMGASGRPGSDGSAVRLQAQRPAGPEVAFSEQPDEVAEAAFVAGRIKALLRAGTPAREVAVLVRINAQSEAFEEALAAEGVPYVVRGAERFFQRAEVRQAVTLVRGSARSGEGAGLTGDELVQQTRDVLGGMGFTDEAPTSRGNVRDRWESLNALLTLARTFADAQPEADLAAFVDDLDRRAAEQHAPVAEGVTIATLHTAKGLEWDAVFLAGAHEGALPITYAMDSPTAIEEERRLCYVGVTRAREHLTVSWSLTRNPGGRGSRKLSRFFDGIAPQALTTTQRPTSSQKNKKSATCRVCGAVLTTTLARKLGRCETCESPYDEELFERLRAWRLEKAGEESVPAFVIFTDATLRALAEVQPRSERELLRVNGIGASKRERYGDEVLALIAASGE
ncbi:ATP-dependent DNA helicase UvrD2 [Nocardioides marmoribigeumensis]|uniref:DNA 3'-5' helicase n=1 Tax=Nocardioides marmoribigeumensis TaxID=433649 RepID=A0ABU2BV59_9ACTN|nr:ATP-dependent DNA helicase UvrD2 [Nocardioides marmoribigeumensis]MDR7361633.1 DNA helicase-2/ATP-dependent DNA helicase PcrA [Nocardioides marmoribigeumensis]